MSTHHLTALNTAQIERRGDCDGRAYICNSHRESAIPKLAGCRRSEIGSSLLATIPAVPEFS